MYKDCIIALVTMFTYLYWFSFVAILFFVYNSFVSPKYRIVFLRPKTIKLGTLSVDEITIFEWKPLCSIKTFYFNKGEAQEIYHTHSFSAISILLYGNYVEAFYDEKNKEFSEENRNRSIIIYIPQERFHQITKSEGCRTMMITGPWGDTYKEFKKETNEIIVSTHGRKEVSRYDAH